MDEKQTSAWITDYISAWNAHDGEAVGEMIAEDIRFVDYALGEVFEGREAVRTFVSEMTETFSTDHRFTLESVVESGDSYSFEWILSGTNDRPDAARGLPATGAHFEIPGVSIGRREGGLISENHDYWNLAGYLMQVGLMPQPEKAAATS
jgi:steroid delta-isomerase-like uncharacterized protein